MLRANNKTSKQQSFQSMVLPSSGHDHTQTSSLQVTARHWQPCSTSSKMNASENQFSTCHFSKHHYETRREISPVKYLDFRVAVPVNSSAEYIAGYVQSTLENRFQYDEQIGAGLNSCWRGTTRPEQYQNLGPVEELTTYNLRETRSSSVCFLPIASSKTKSIKHNKTCGGHVNDTSTNYGKSSPSLSIKTLETADLTESSSYSNFSTPSASRNCSPSTTVDVNSFTSQYSHQPELPEYFNIESRHKDFESKLFWELSQLLVPKIVQNRKSLAYANDTNEDVQPRKARIKTELCKHYKNGTACPFGSSK
jgi:hypothetical protein